MSLLEEYNTYVARDLQNKVEYKTEEIEITSLGELFDSNPQLVELTEDHPLYDHENKMKQYQIIKIEHNNDKVTVTYYKLLSGHTDSKVNIATYYQEYLATGKISINTGQLLHMLPIPVYTLSQIGNTFVPTVKLKNGKRAIIHNGKIEEGVMEE